MLCLGQGEELCWIRNPVPVSQSSIIDIFRLKTAPAFEVALLLGAIYAGADEEICNVLSAFSRSLGIAYQISDDLADFNSDHKTDGDRSAGLSLLLAIACDNTDESDRKEVVRLWSEQKGNTDRTEKIRNLIKQTGAAEKANQLFEHYKKEAIRALTPLQNAHLKSLLCRISTRILTNR